MEFCKGELVMCIAGREKDRLMCVAEFDGKYVYVCDGISSSCAFFPIIFKPSATLS